MSTASNSLTLLSGNGINVGDEGCAHVPCFAHNIKFTDDFLHDNEGNSVGLVSIIL